MYNSTKEVRLVADDATQQKHNTTDAFSNAKTFHHFKSNVPKSLSNLHLLTMLVWAKCMCMYALVTNFISCHLWAFSFSLVYPSRSLFTLLPSIATWMCSTPWFFTIRTCWSLTQPLLFYVLHFPSIMRPFNGIFYRNHQNGHLWFNVRSLFFSLPVSLLVMFVYVCVCSWQFFTDGIHSMYMRSIEINLKRVQCV